MNQTFGCEADLVWVKHGCRALIRCGEQDVPCGVQQAYPITYKCPCGNGSAWFATARPRAVELVHIPKTAGSSLRVILNTELGAHLARPGPAKEWAGRVVSGDELCLPDTGHLNFRISFFRDPRSHVVSQYLECRRASWALMKRGQQELLTSYSEQVAQPAAAALHDVSAARCKQYCRHDAVSCLRPDCRACGWCKRNTTKPGREREHEVVRKRRRIGTPAPLPFAENVSYAHGFAEWLHLFERDTKHHAFGCYSPLNMQARAMTCCVGRQPDGTPRCANRDTHLVLAEPVPNLHAAIQALSQLDVVGITEHFQLSVCLLTHRLRRVPKPECFCDASGQRHERRVGVREVHENARSTNSTLAANSDTVRELLPTIDVLTTVDRLLYQRALRRFVADVQRMEQEIGRGPMLCGELPASV